MGEEQAGGEQDAQRHTCKGDEGVNLVSGADDDHGCNRYRKQTHQRDRHLEQSRRPFPGSLIP